MKHRGWMGLIVGFSVALVIASGPALAQQDQQDVARRAAQVGGPTEVQIWKAIIADSISAYPHSCPCPYSPNRAGRACGERSAYSRVAGASGALMCYPQDIPDSEIARYRERMQ
jgi:hypothetical protein